MSDSPFEKNIPFCHLHLHTDYSLLDGASKAEKYLELAKEYNHTSMAITDHGNMSGTFYFYQKCKEFKVKPIIGIEAYVNDNINQYEEKKDEGKDGHIILFAKNKQGYTNLNKLVYLSFTEGYYRRGRITTELLFKHKEGIICGSACMGSVFGKLILDKKEEEAELLFKKFIDEFGEDFYAEIQLNEIKEQKTYNDFIVKMIKKYNVMPVITADVHYAKFEDKILQDIKIAINQQKPVGEAFSIHSNSLFYCNSEYFFEINKKFNHNYEESFIKECLENTLKITEKCNFDFEVGIEKYPKYEPTEDVVKYFGSSDTKEIIYKLAHAKLNQKLKEYQKNKIVKIDNDVIKQYRDKLNFELKVIEDKKMLDYFMVIWEFVKFCKSKNVINGCGRGSSAGCLLSWCLEITKIDPIRFNLYFERFLNPERHAVPDIDLDCQADTDDITMEFLLNKYGKDRIFPVVTFGTFNEKGCLRDVTKALGYDSGLHSDVSIVAKEMPDVFEMSLEEWCKTYPNQEECSEKTRNWLLDSKNQEIIEYTIRLQGQVRHLGKHAAGVVITPSSIWEHMPINIVKGIIVTGFQESGSGKDLSDLGYLKFDRLKLETINVIEDAKKLIKEHKGIDIQEKIDNIDLNDQNLYTELKAGNNYGIFQFESPGINSLIKGIRVENFNELVATNALFRPGPMTIGAHDEYIKNKFIPINERQYVHPSLIPLLEDTNGVLIYQEQLMFIANKIGGMTLGEGDNLRKVMDKASKIISKKAKGEELTKEEENNKNYKEYKKLWDKLKEGAKSNGLGEKEVTDIEQWLIKYLGYSFCLSHALSYSYISAQTLFLKHYYPTEFYTALLNHPKGKDKEEKNRRIQATILAALIKGIEILPPTRKTNWDWTMVSENKISMGFSAINGLGEIAYKELLNNKINTITKEEFFTTKFSKFNKTSFESCLKAKLFDDWSDSREELTELRNLKLKDCKQLDLFGETDFFVAEKIIKKKYTTTPEDIKEKQFKEVCGFDLDLLKKTSVLKKIFYEKTGQNISSVINYDDTNPGVYYYFLLEKIEQRKSKNGKPYTLLVVSDGTYQKNMVMWDKMYNKIKDMLIINNFYVTKFKRIDAFVQFQEGAQFRKAPV